MKSIEIDAGRNAEKAIDSFWLQAVTRFNFPTFFEKIFWFLIQCKYFPIAFNQRQAADQLICLESDGPKRAPDIYELHQQSCDCCGPDRTSPFNTARAIFICIIHNAFGSDLKEFGREVEDFKNIWQTKAMHCMKEARIFASLDRRQMCKNESFLSASLGASWWGVPTRTRNLVHYLLLLRRIRVFVRYKHRSEDICLVT